MLSVQDMQTPDRLARYRRQRFDVLRELAEAYAAMGRFDDARRCYTQAAGLEPREASPLVGLGVVAVQQGMLDEAEEAFRAAARRQDDCAEAYGGLAIVRQQRGDYAGAFDMHLKCLELDADNLVALLGLFQASVRMGTFAKVIRYLEIYLDRHPGDVAVLFCLATLYARDGRLEEAREALLSVLALEPDKKEAVELLRQVRAGLAGRRGAEAVNV
ncbi:MAG: tetratricopeptide repeat protein [Planctomycetes bacterium]|nr:tetratricopeptide repeat protein [Planctomycetota bacterium]